MQTIKDDRRTIHIHRDADVEDLPLTGSVSLPPVADRASFVPAHMDDPKLFMGDVIVGVSDGEISFAELIVDLDDDAVITYPLNGDLQGRVPNNIFTARIFQSDEVHIYEGIGETVEESDVELDASKLKRPIEGMER